MLNKLKFNNLVISNKRGIQQSRIQTINKLVHKIRKLKTLLEKRPDDDKCKERIRKSSESMEILKKLKRVEIMKHVLLLEKSPAAIITNGLSTPEEIAVALLGMNKVMLVLIKRFKAELQLSDDRDGKWREELMESSKRRQKIERTEQKKLKRKTLKEQKAMEHKRKEWLEQNYENDDSTKEGDISTVGGWKIEEVANETEDIKEIKNELKTMPLHKKTPKKLNNIEEIKRNNTEREAAAIMPQFKRAKEEKLEETSMPKKQKPNEKISKKVIKFSDNESSEDDITLQGNEMDPASDDEETESHVVDPFFVTDTGDNYLSTAVIKRRQDSQGKDSNTNQADLHLIKLNGSKTHTNFRERKLDNNDRRPHQKNWKDNQNGVTWKHGDKRNQNSNNNKNSWHKGRDNKNNGEQNKWTSSNEGKSNRHTQDRFANQSKVKMNTKPNEKLHPSWAAKQKQKPIIAGFQGKKITFDNDGSTKVINDKVSSQPHGNASKKDSAPSSSLKSESLHPSWAAKQKLKPTIAAFQGKKITFDADD